MSRNAIPTPALDCRVGGLPELLMRALGSNAARVLLRGSAADAASCRHHARSAAVICSSAL